MVEQLIQQNLFWFIRVITLVEYYGIKQFNKKIIHQLIMVGGYISSSKKIIHELMVVGGYLEPLIQQNLFWFITVEYYGIKQFYKKIIHQLIMVGGYISSSKKNNSRTDGGGSRVCVTAYVRTAYTIVFSAKYGTIQLLHARMYKQLSMKAYYSK